MNFIERAAARVAVGALAVAAAAAPVAAQAATTSGAGTAAAADTAPVTASISISPDPTVTVGSQVTITASATNNTSSTISGALGIENPQYASEKITGISGCAARNLQKLIYCGDTQWAPGATIKIVLTLTATAAGTDNFTVYARGTGSDDVYANESLTVS